MYNYKSALKKKEWSPIKKPRIKDSRLGLQTQEYLPEKELFELRSKGQG